MNSDQAASRQEYFEALYKGDPDPWRYQSGPYEIDKRADTLTFLRDRYTSACEVGCSIGILTAALAPRCDHLIGIDISPTAAAIARARFESDPSVRIEVLHLPYDDIAFQLDLLVLSEMLYFLNPGEIVDLARFATRRVLCGGDVLIVSFDGETQTKLNGPQSTEIFCSTAADDFVVVRAEQRQHYHVRLLRRRHDAE